MRDQCQDARRERRRARLRKRGRWTRTKRKGQHPHSNTSLLLTLNVLNPSFSFFCLSSSVYPLYAMLCRLRCALLVLDRCSPLVTQCASRLGVLSSLTWTARAAQVSGGPTAPSFRPLGRHVSPSSRLALPHAVGSPPLAYPHTSDCA